MFDKESKFPVKRFIVIFIIFSVFIAGSMILSVKDGKADKKGSSSKDTSELEYVGDIVAIQGNGLKVQRINSPHQLMARVNMPDYVQDVLETDDKTMACIEFHNGSQLSINKKTRIQIISSSKAKDITNRSVVDTVILQAGEVWAKVQGDGSGQFKIETDQGVLGVKGTEFVVEKDSTGTEKITVLEGNVEYTSQDGQITAVSLGEEMTYKQGTQIQKRKEDIKKLRDNLNLRFPNLHPGVQTMIAVFAGRIHNSAEISKALSMANQTLDMVENPENYAMDTAQAEIDRTGIGIPLPRGNREARREKMKQRVQGLSPDRQTIDSYYPSFTWEEVEGAKYYRIMVTRRAIQKGEKDPGYYMQEVTEKTGIIYPDSARVLKPGVNYFWIVIPLDENKKPLAPPSQPARFTMADYNTLGVKGLSPCGEIDAVAGDMIFDWTSVRGAKKFRVEIADDENFDHCLIDQETQTNFLVVENADKKFLKNRNYYWRATPIEGTSLESAVNRFKMVSGK